MKLQRSTNIQAPIKRDLGRYPDGANGAWVLNESNDNQPARHAFDLEERTAQFGETIIRFCQKLPRSAANDRLIGQLVGCGTSIGANYCEANEGVSKKDFKNTIGRCVKEAKELHLIFASIFRK
jgi:four helix bundle protein